jgi:hypothetical protein
VSETRTPDDSIELVLRAAHELGIELDESEAREWIASVSREASRPVEVDVNTGIYGHRVTMADIDDSELARYRVIGKIVGFEDRAPDVLTALALSGSAAQNRVHRFPGDCDFFERVHIRAETKIAACDILADLMRSKALATLSGAGYRLQEAKFGSWPEDAMVDGKAISTGAPVSWTPAQIEAGHIEYHDGQGAQRRLTWEQVARDPGWCKLDWIVADPEHGGVANASNVLDATWEAPDGSITPLDGFLDPYFQEVYLDVETIPLFTKLVKDLGADSVAEYVERLTDEVYKYTVKSPNYGKAARRLYNIFRLTGQYAEAAYIRELFDEPTTALYQISSLLRALHEAADGGEAFDTEPMVAQVDRLIMSAVDALDGPTEAEVVHRLLKLRDAIGRRESADSIAEDVAEVQASAMSAVDDYFRRALYGVSSIGRYLDDLAGSER